MRGLVPVWKGHTHYLKLPAWTLHTALPLPFQGEDFAVLPQEQENAAFSVLTLSYAWTKERIVVDVSNSLVQQAKPADIHLGLWPSPPNPVCLSSRSQLSESNESVWDHDFRGTSSQGGGLGTLGSWVVGIEMNACMSYCQYFLSLIGNHV